MSNKVRMTVAALAISGTALIGIALKEGYRGNAYDDGVGIQTIGFGTTDGVKKGDTITVPRALVRLGKNVGEKEQAMKKCLGDVALYQHEWDAYVSLTYHIGSGAFCSSTIVRNLKKTPPDYFGACKHIFDWKYAKGKIRPDFYERRHKEYAECMGSYMGLK